MESDLKESLSLCWRTSGISQGDTVLLHSDVKRLVRSHLRRGIRLTIEQILESFLLAVGTEGTLLLPLFNFDFTKGTPFDIRRSPSQMGAITEAGRLAPGAVRTGHPIYSFAVIGAKAHLFEAVNNRSAYGEDSPFGLVRSLNGKIAVLDLPDQHSMTFYHHVEELNRVPYRHHKEFRGQYTDALGNISTQTYSIYVRDLERHVVTAVNPMGEILWESGVYSGDRPGEGGGLRVAAADRVFESVSGVIQSRQTKGILYDISEAA